MGISSSLPFASTSVTSTAVPEQWRDRRLGWCDIWYRATPEGNLYATDVSGPKQKVKPLAWGKGNESALVPVP